MKFLFLSLPPSLSVSFLSVLSPGRWSQSGLHSDSEWFQSLLEKRGRRKSSLSSPPSKPMRNQQSRVQEPSAPFLLPIPTATPGLLLNLFSQVSLNLLLATSQASSNLETFRGVCQMPSRGARPQTGDFSGSWAGGAWRPNLGQDYGRGRARPPASCVNFHVPGPLLLATCSSLAPREASFRRYNVSHRYTHLQKR